jgi:hypothetical protein
MLEQEEEVFDTCKITFEYEYTINGEKITTKDFIDVLGDLTDEEIDSEVKEKVKENIKQNYPKEEFKYERRGFEGRELQISISSETRESASNQYYCSTKPSRIETCVCLSSSKITCYYETCGSSPYGRCILGEWRPI